MALIKPIVVCLIGSTRFKDEFVKANLAETLKGHIVLTIGCDLRSDDEIFSQMPEAEKLRVKTLLDLLHLEKIEMADEVLVLNVGGYIGASTTRELYWALFLGRRVNYLEEKWRPVALAAVDKFSDGVEADEVLKLHKGPPRQNPLYAGLYQ